MSRESSLAGWVLGCLPLRAPARGAGLAKNSVSQAPLSRWGEAWESECRKLSPLLITMLMKLGLVAPDLVQTHPPTEEGAETWRGNVGGALWWQNWARGVPPRPAVKPPGELGAAF